MRGVDDSESPLPREIALAWGLGDGPRRGRRPSLDLGAITAAAVAIADRDGLAAVSMNRLASDLGVSAMSLYRYVESKDELVQLIADAALGFPDIPERLGDDWRTELEEWTLRASERFRAHPWITEIPSLSLPVMPCNLAWMDYALRVLEHTPLPYQERLGIVVLLSGYARTMAATSVGLARGYAASGTAAEAADDAYARTLAAVTDAERFPALRALVDDHLLTADAGPDGPDHATAEDELFRFGLDRVLDGIGMLVARGAARSDAAGS